MNKTTTRISHQKTHRPPSVYHKQFTEKTRKKLSALKENENNFKATSICISLQRITAKETMKQKGNPTN